MSLEQNEYTITQYQKEKIHTFVGSPYPTHAEILAGKQNTIPNEALIDLKERGVRVDSDVVAVLMDIYGIEEIPEEPIKELTMLYAALQVGALLSASRGVVEAANGYPEDAFTQWYISVGMYSISYAMNVLSQNKHRERLDKFLRAHWPPLHSSQALQDAYLKGYLKGRTERDKNHIVELLNKQSKNELAGEQRPDMLIFLQILQGDQILEDAQTRFLYEYEMLTLEDIYSHMQGDNRDVIYTHFGDHQCELITMLVSEYRSGSYPLGYEFEIHD